MFALRELMTEWPTFLPMDTSIAEAARSVDAHRMGVMPVCSPDRVLQGLVGHRQLANLVRRGHDPLLTTVGEMVLSTDVPSIEVDDPLEVALFAMQVHSARYLPVVEDGVLVGMVGKAELLAAIPAQRQSIEDMTELVA